MNPTLTQAVAGIVLVIIVGCFYFGLADLRRLTRNELKLAELRELREQEVVEGRVIDWSLLDWLPEAPDFKVPG